MSHWCSFRLYLGSSARIKTVTEYRKSLEKVKSFIEEYPYEYLTHFLLDAGTEIELDSVKPGVPFQCEIYYNDEGTLGLTAEIQEAAIKAGFNYKLEDYEELCYHAHIEGKEDSGCLDRDFRETYIVLSSLESEEFKNLNGSEIASKIKGLSDTKLYYTILEKQE